MPMHRLATLALVAAAVVASGCGNAREVKDPRGTVQNAYGCDRCHGYPPSPGWTAEAAAHPQGDRVVANCSYCHPQTVRADNHTLIPASEGGHHQNGKIDFVRGHLPSAEGVGYGDPSQHVPDALKGLARTGEAQDCYVCHGADLNGGIGYSCVACHIAPHGSDRFPKGAADFRTNCTFCHGQAKEPFDYEADLNLAAPPVAIFTHRDDDTATGAHQAHLSNGVACASCHEVPGATFPGSLDHITGTAEVALTGVATAQGATAAFDPATVTCASYCHGATMKGGSNTTPKWTDGAQDCKSCHGSPPPTGFTVGGAVGWHAFHVDARGLDCGKCHKGYVKDTSVNAAQHVNGTVEVVVDDGTADGFPITPVANADHNWACSECQTCHEHLGLAQPTCQ